MGTTFWIKRFFTVLMGAFIVIGVVQMLKGHDLRYSVTEAAIWGVITATVFTVGRLYQSHRGRHCAICKDTPEMHQVDRDGDA